MNDDATLNSANAAQARAAAPATHVWVSANAGSGKTHVLVNRLARLMLRGTPPSRILCLTFTNAAAAEMQNRLFARLADWALMDDEQLTDQLALLTGAAVGDDERRRARRLFTAALESPGGLKIHTIHAFCASILQRFPLEAGVAPNFRTLDEQARAEMLVSIRDRVMSRAATDTGSPLAEALSTVSGLMHDAGLDGLFSEFLKRRRIFTALIATPDGPEAASDALATAFEAGPDERSTASVIDHYFGATSVDREIANAAAAHLRTGTKTDLDAAPAMSALSDLPAGTDPAGLARAHIDAFCTKAGKPRARLMTAALRKARPELAEWIDAELLRATDFHRATAVAGTLEATRAALLLGTEVVREYERAKRRATLLDYDDLIARAHSLLARAEDRDWVLYKLDGGIDHILVDEAQDTSPEQWEIVAGLAEDMVSGESARPGLTRTVFAVGDEKQSIFSFQGARPEMFAEMRDHFSSRAREANLAWDAVPLDVSFRSAPEILTAVDAVFAAEEAARGLNADNSPTHHRYHRDGPGRVELWPVLTVDETAADDPWTVPVDYSGSADPRAHLAREIADEIALWLREGRVRTPSVDPVRPGDILILVRRRDRFVEAMVRELKARAIPVAGVDRMRLTQQLVVMDLMALARFATLPEDDYSLAALLKSPLIGLEEDDLFDLAYDRGQRTLWRSLSEKAESHPGYAAAHNILAGVLAGADRLSPFAFFANFLAAPGRREAIYRRLGVEAADPIGEFLDAALHYETVETPTLDKFLAWLERGDIEIKRDMEHGHDEVRVMTVHGAKGLEAEIVILADTCALPRGGRGFALADVEVPGRALTLPVWPRAARDIIAPLDAARDRLADEQAREYRRLLYVAMTRARDWLIVAGYEGKTRRPAGCWYDLIAEGLQTHFPAPGIDAGNGRLRYVLEGDGADQRVSAAEPAAESSEPATALPDWALQNPARVERGHRLTPSGAEGEDAPAALSPVGETRAMRIRRGTLVHSLLEHLPAFAPGGRRDAALRHLGQVAGDLDEDRRAELADEALGVLNAPDFAPFLGADARAEIAFAAELETKAGPLAVEGRVDRLRLDGDVLHVVDYKTRRPAAASPDEVPAAILRQMALYRAALAQIYRVGEVRVWVVWTDGARLMELPGALLDPALDEALAGAFVDGAASP